MTDSSVDTTTVHPPLARAIESLRQAIAALRTACEAEASVMPLDFVLESDHEQPPDDPSRSAHTKP
jgi:hypothetical protein